MKQHIIHYAASFFLAAAALTACVDDDYLETDKGHDTLVLSANQTEVVLDEQYHADNALELTWSTGTNYGTGNRITYTVELAEAGTGFAAPYAVVEDAVQQYTWTATVEDLNNLLRDQFGATGGQTVNLEARVTARVAGLDADRFNNQNWIQGGAGSPYEFKIGNAYAGAFRVDNYSVRGLRLSLSGYYGKSASNSLKQYKFEGLSGKVLIGSFDFAYNDHDWIARGGVTYGYLSHSAEIAEANRSLKGMGISPGTNIGETAISVGVEAGYDLLALAPNVKERHRLYLFGRYDFYDPMLTMGKTRRGVPLADEEQWGRQRVAVGLNYYPLPQIVIKGEYAHRIFKSQYNNEPALSLGVAYSGLFTR